MKKIISITLAAMMAVSAASFTAMADDEPINVLINGVELVIPDGDTQPFIEDSRTLVPMRAIFEALGAHVDWDGDTKTIVSYDPVSDVSIVMQIGSKNMFVGETQVELDVPAKIENDRTVVPVRAIAEGMNSKVDWDGVARTVTITKNTTNGEQQDGDETETDEPVTGQSEIANPWTEYATIDELDAAISTLSDGLFKAPDLAEPVVVNENGYRYLVGDNMIEIDARWDAGESGDVVVRVAPVLDGTADISGISGAEKVDEYVVNSDQEITADIYKYNNTVYAVWSSSYNGVELNKSVAVTADDWDPSEVVITILKDVETQLAN